jgi:hypothetical protein
MGNPTEIDLQPFCSTDKTRPSLLQPFTHGPWSYATDGRILVRVPRREGAVCQGPFEPPPRFKLDAHLWVSFPHEEEPIALPELPQKLRQMRECPWCRGTGNDDRATCEECDGEGHIQETVRVAVGEMHFAAHYVALVKALPDVRFFLPLQRTGTTLHAATFTFSGEGRGVLMPMRTND